MTKIMIRAWIDAVLKPMAGQWVKDGLPLEQFGGILLGYGVSMLRGAGQTPDQIRDALEGALEGSTPEN